jgi:hypothetical protein
MQTLPLPEPAGRGARAGRPGSARRDPMPILDFTGRDLLRRWWRLAIVVAVVVVAVVFRRDKDELGLWPNVELLTATAFLAAVLLRNKWAAIAPLAIVAFSDLTIGNTRILVFTWSAWVAIGLGSLLARRTRGWRRLGAAFGFGIGGTAFFYLWTNFGVWALDGMYPPTWDGLIASYAAGVPFLRPQLVANLFFVPAAAGIAVLVERAERAVAVNAMAKAMLATPK